MVLVTTSIVVDHRNPLEPPVQYVLSAAETELYDFLDSGVADKLLAGNFGTDRPAAYRSLGGELGVRSVVARWLAADLVAAIDGKLLALAVRIGRRSSRPLLAAEGLPYADVAAGAGS